MTRVRSHRRHVWFSRKIVLQHQPAERKLLFGRVLVCRCDLLNKRKISKCRIADFTTMPHSFSTTSQPLTPASSQQQRWSFQCHVYSERVLLHLAGQFNALSLRKKVSKGDRLFTGGSRLYVFSLGVSPVCHHRLLSKRRRVAFGERVQRTHGQISRRMRS